MVDINATLIAQIINFLILVALLAKVAYKPLINVLEERKTRIESQMAAAEQEKLQAETLRQENERLLSEARAQAQSIVDKAVKLAEKSKEDIILEARKEQERLIKAAQEEISREKDAALAQMRAEMVSVSLAAATKIIGDNLDQEKNAKLVTDFINQLDREKIGGLPC